MAKNFSQFFAQLVIQKHSTFPSLRLYARWMNRNPAKVLLPFEPTANPSLKKEKVISLDPEILTKTKEIKTSELPTQQESYKDTKVGDIKQNPTQKLKFKKIKSEREEKLKKRLFYLSQKKVFDDNNELIYEKLKENDGRLSSLLVKLKSKKDRQRLGQVLVEGWRLVEEGLHAKCKLKYVIFSQLEDLNNLRPYLPKTGTVLYKIPYKEIELWSDVETSSGIFGVFEMPKPENMVRPAQPLPLNFICDNIRVPGNLGAILRVAVGVGCEKVLLTKGCVDLWDPKVIRSAAGAHFRLPIHPSVEWQEMSNYLEQETSIVVADSNAKIDDIEDHTEFKEVSQELQIPVVPYYGVEFANMKHITLIIGGETEGISRDSYHLAATSNGLRLNIPLQRGIDSLNTGMATAIIAFEIRKQLIKAWTKAKLERQNVLSS
ncbi:unnamed protein product [Diatraea saccharalis]|uniref:RNA 2-O ribose methyltransferase substrate binding domain-containing protein n=1 Tax=Diatraea saccharalis TaxID=40085 RepID=A0A9N9QUK9_9NEOP|nr:unnamed protein product [Diatraea saccharalis]